MQLFSAALGKAPDYSELLEKVHQEIESATLEELEILVRRFHEETEGCTLNHTVAPGAAALRKPSVARLITAPMNTLKKAPPAFGKLLDRLDALAASVQKRRNQQPRVEAEIRKAIKKLVKDLME